MEDSKVSRVMPSHPAPRKPTTPASAEPPRLDPETIQILLENQKKELSIREQEVANQMVREDRQIKFAEKAMLVKADQADKDRASNHRTFRWFMGVGLLVVAVLIAAACFLAYIGKSELVEKGLMLAGTALTSGAGGYGIRAIQDKNKSDDGKDSE